MKNKTIMAGILLILLMYIAPVPALAMDAGDVTSSFDTIAARFPELAKYVSDAKEWLSDPQNASFINKEGRADIIAGNIRMALETAGAAAKLADLNRRQIDAIVGYMTDSVKAVNLKLVFDAANMRVTITDANGKIVASYSVPIKQTGSGLNAGCFAPALFPLALLWLYYKRTVSEDTA
ncbi:MAG: hypothetical protein LBH95_05575 [Oscillospiraceae bacterium]|nr:hypothetical protein [Oscillospiraceae bacterium]